MFGSFSCFHSAIVYLFMTIQWIAFGKIQGCSRRETQEWILTKERFTEDGNIYTVFYKYENAIRLGSGLSRRGFLK